MKSGVPPVGEFLMRSFAVLCCALILAVGAGAVTPQNPQAPVFRSTSDVVPLFVTVVDKSGHLVTDLGQDDFRVLDNGKPQPLTVFASSPQPIRLIILIDVSGSMAGNGPLLGRAFSGLVNRLGPDDRARVGIFGREIAISPTFTRDAQALAAWLPRTLPANAPTPLWSAVQQAIGEFTAVKEEGRRVVLVMSDSKDSGPLRFGKILSPLDIIDLADREDVMVYGIGVRSSLGPAMAAPGNLGAMMASTLPDPGLGKVADDTGGGYFELLPRDDLAETCARVIDELHQQYLLGFAPPARDGKTHKIEIRFARSGLKARVRKAYVAPR
jgi:Ca-activated chloride channel family protein